jgi:hypothetical protein
MAINNSDINTFFTSYSAAWAANDSAAIAGHWDGSDPALFYKAEEISAVFTRWEQVTQYWAHNEAFHEKVRLQFSQPQICPMPTGYSVVIVKMRWDIAFASGNDTFEGEEFAHGGKAMGGINHTLCLMKETPNGLKLCGWSETPDAPITYMAKLYEWAASDDFKAR